MRCATVEQSKRIDERAQKEFSLPGDVLMEAAGCAAAREISQSYIPEASRGAIGIVCGPGNNGGDGLVVARHLHSAGLKNVFVFLIAPEKKRTGLFRVQLERAKKQRLDIVDLEASDRSGLLRLSSMSLVVDAIFGIGFKGKITTPYLEVIETINVSRAPKVSLDTPSGLDCDRGVVGGVAVKAHQTITFGLAKPGFFVNEGPEHVGRLRVLSIGFPRTLMKECASTHFALTDRQVRKALPKRGATTHKSDHGHALLIAGSSGMWGAGLLSASSAYRVGSGYVTLASHDDPIEALKTVPEILTAKATDDKLWEAPRWTAAGIGPGLGTGEATHQLLVRLKKKKGSRVVVDADAITVIAEKKMYPLPEEWILTPHAGELSRLLKVSAKEIESDRFKYALEAARLTGCHVLLKGYRTVLAKGDRAIVILSGNSALAKAGTGDVLTGMITGLLAQKMSPLMAAACGAYIHGRMADEWLRAGNDRRSLQASDLRDILPGLMQRLSK